MSRPSVGALAMIGAAALLAAGCGSGKKASTSAATSAPAASTQAPSTQASAPTPASSPGTAILVKHAGKLGSVLAAGSKRMTVYLFEGDKGAVSACSGACASAWPPVRTSGSPLAMHGAVTGELGTIKRSDGTMQITYHGHPLYYFVKDKDSGDAYGEGVKAFGADWYALSPKGAKVDNS